MMSLDIQAAVSALQQQTDVMKTSLDSFELDRNERALDELVRNPGKTGAPRHLVRSARANALKVVKLRAKYCELSLDADLYAATRARVETAVTFDPLADVEMLDWLDTTPSVTTAQRSLLKALVAGYDAGSLALFMDLPVQRVRERISRARKAAYAGYLAEVMGA